MAKKRDKSRMILSSPGADKQAALNGSIKNQKPQKERRTVNSLTEEQLEKKRANDREAQRKIRERNRRIAELNDRQCTRLDDLENQVRRLKAEISILTELCKIHDHADALRKIHELHELNYALRLELEKVSSTSGILWQLPRPPVPPSPASDESLALPQGHPHSGSEQGGFGHVTSCGPQDPISTWSSRDPLTAMVPLEKHEASSSTRSDELFYGADTGWRSAGAHSHDLAVTEPPSIPIPPSASNLDYGQTLSSHCHQALAILANPHRQHQIPTTTNKNYISNLNGLHPRQFLPYNHIDTQSYHPPTHRDLTPQNSTPEHRAVEQNQLHHLSGPTESSVSSLPDIHQGSAQSRQPHLFHPYVHH